MLLRTASVDVGTTPRQEQRTTAPVVPSPVPASLSRAVDRPTWLAGLVILLLVVPGAESGEDPASVHARPADLAAALLVLLVGRLLITGRLGVRIQKPLVAIGAAMVLAGGLSALTAHDQMRALVGWARFTEVFVLVPIAVALSIRSRGDALWIIVPLVAVGGLEGALGLHQHLTGTGASYGSANTRAIGTFGAYEIMGLATVVGCTIIVLTAVAVVAKGPIRWLALAGAVGLLAPLAFSYSRGAWIGTAAGVIVVVLLGGWRRGVVVLCIATLAAVTLAPTLSPTNPLVTRFSGITSSVSNPDTSVNDRYGLWKAAGAMWRDHPVAGVGIKNFPHYRDRYAPVSVSSASDIGDAQAGFRRVELLSPHNLYLLVLSEQGLAGALAWAAALLALLVAGVRRFRRQRLDMTTRLLGVVAAGVGARFLVTSLYGDVGGQTTLLVSVLLGVVVWWAHGQPLLSARGRSAARRVKAAVRPAVTRAPVAVPRVQGERRTGSGVGLLRERSTIAIGVAVLVMVASVLGLVRDLTIARFFGASAETDAFLVAWSVPETATPLLMEGVMGLFLVPFMARALHREGSLAPTVSRTLPTVLAVLTGFAVLLALGAPWCVRILAPGLAEPDLAITSFRIAASTVLSLGVCGYLTALLKTSSSFLAPASVNIAWNVGIIGAIVGLSATVGIESAAIGLAVGGAAMVLVQIPMALRKIGIPRLRWTVSRALLARSIIVLPVATYALSRQAQTYAERFFGSQLAPGSISHLNFAFKVGQLAITISLVAIWVAFPAMARAAMTSEPAALAGKLHRELRIAIALVLPQIAALIIFAPQVIHLLFSRGEFDAADARATAVILQVMALGLIGQTVFNVVVLFLFAMDARNSGPAVAAAAGLAVTVAVDALGYRWLGAPGLAMGSAAGILTSAGLAVWAVRRRAIPLDLGALGGFIMRCLLAATVSAAAAVLAVDLLPGRETGLGQMALGGVVLLAGYACVLRATRLDRSNRNLPANFHNEGSNMKIASLPFRANGTLLMLCCVLLGTIGGLLFAELSTTKYSARSVVIVVPRPGAEDAAPVNLAKTYGRITTDPAVLGPALSQQSLRMTPNKAAEALSVSVAPDGPVIEVVATSRWPADAAALANAAVAGLVQYADQHQVDTRVRVASLVSASAPTSPVSPNLRLDMAIGAALGFVVGALLRTLRPRRTLSSNGDGGLRRRNNHLPDDDDLMALASSSAVTRRPRRSVLEDE